MKTAKRKDHLYLPTLFIALFIILQAILLLLYIKAKNSTENITWHTFRQSIIPSVITSVNNWAEQELVSPVGTTASGIPILLYHGVTEKSDGSNVTVEQFREQMFALKENGYSAISLDDFLLFMDKKKNLPEKSFLLTFDDGRKDSYYPVDPILVALNYKATIFVITGNSEYNKGSTYYLSDAELKKMISSGRWSVQPHTKNGHELINLGEDRQGHYYSNLLWLEDQLRLESDDEFRIRVENDLKYAKEDVEKLGAIVRTFAFPFGDFGQETINNPNATTTLKDAIKHYYTFAFRQERIDTDFSQNYQGADIQYLTRLEVNSNWNAKNLIAVLEAGKIKPLPFSDNFSTYKGWRKKVGDVSIQNDSLTIDSDGNSTAIAVLDGSQLWNNYKVDVELDWIKGSNILISPKYLSESELAFCNFGKERTRIEQEVDGKIEIVVEQMHPINATFSGTLSASIFSDTITCSINNKAILKGRIKKTKPNGGLAIEIWDKVKGNSLIHVKNVKVNPIVTSIIGDFNNIEPALIKRADVLFFAGFEGQPNWTDTVPITDNKNLSNSKVVTDESNNRALEVFYQKGSYASPNSQVGTSSTIFHIDFSPKGIGIGKHEDLYFRYMVKFEDKFEFQKSGKLPGLAGGNSNSGGNPPDGYDGWSGRLSWTKNGGIINYMYIPGIEKYGKQFPWSLNGRTTLLTPGKWQCLEMHYSLNDPGKNNGVIQGWIDEQLALERHDINFRNTDSLKIDNIMFDTFFGGDTPDFASPKDQTAQFDNFVVATEYIGCPDTP